MGMNEERVHDENWKEEIREYVLILSRSPIPFSILSTHPEEPSSESKAVFASENQLKLYRMWRYWVLLDSMVWDHLNPARQCRMVLCNVWRKYSISKSPHCWFHACYHSLDVGWHELCVSCAMFETCSNANSSHECQPIPSSWYMSRAFENIIILVVHFWKL